MTGVRAVGLAVLVLIVAACSDVTDPTLAIDADPGGAEHDEVAETPDTEPDDDRSETGTDPTPGPAPRPAPDAEPDDGAEPRPDQPPTTEVAGDLEVHYLDVGQGDATLLLHDEVAMLIDTGRWQASDVVPHLEARGVDALDLVVITHPHADHIGQFDQVVERLAVDEVWWPGTETTSQTFDRALTALEGSDAVYEEPRAGDTTTIGPLVIDVVNPPAGAAASDIHDAQLALRVTFGEVRLLFTGDAEAATEGRMVARTRELLDADVLQLGHHGSDTSTTSGFLDAVDPAVAVYSAGAGNAYGHPHGSVLDRLDAAGVATYGTDVHGSVVVTTDGATWTVGTQRDGDVAAAPPNAAPDPADTPLPPDPPEAPAAAPPSGSSGACAADQVDVNAAGSGDLQRIIHIGPARAADLPSLRPFTSVQAMDRIAGIGPARLADILAQGVACVG